MHEVKQRPPLLNPSIEHLSQKRGANEERVAAPLADHPCTACVEPLEEEGGSDICHIPIKGLFDLTGVRQHGGDFILWWSGEG